MSTTTIRLPDDLKSRVAAKAERAGTTAQGARAMPRVESTPKVGDDLDRILISLQSMRLMIFRRASMIIRAISILGLNPLIGRSVRGDMWELIIGRRSGGFVALYRYVSEIDTVPVPAVRGQREAGYRG